MGALLDALPFFGGRVRWLRQDRPENCVQTVTAMALGVPTAYIEGEAGTGGSLTIRETIDLLATFGVECRPLRSHLVADFWPEFYRMSGGRRMRALAFAFPPGGDSVGHAFFVVGRKIYDPATGKIRRLSRGLLTHLDYIAIFPESFDNHPEIVRIRTQAKAGE